MKNNIPIYTADITVTPFQRKKNTIIKENPITLHNVVVKGLTVGDIFKRSYNQIVQKIHIGKKARYSFELQDMILLRQHGMGVDD